MAYTYCTNFPLNKSGTKYVSVGLEVHRKNPMILLSRTLDKVEIHLDADEFNHLAQAVNSMTLLLRQDVSSTEPLYLTDNLRIQVISIFECKQVLLERINEKNEVQNALYYCLPTWNNFEALLPCIQHLVTKYRDYSPVFERIVPSIVNYARSMKPEVNFNTLHLNVFQQTMLQIKPNDLPLDNCGDFDKIRCYYELVVYHPYPLALAFNNL